eukprot:TRINITY_DN12698_c0_g1_i1.p1 TRINITY_DN12698_c0_g1~~TRINITY_DN12698_c0_g1_i1.p1  ORF type:complete len:621 (-),score=137.48 TRINITY_DN12698_c0_g1_i1:15-1877(-)
MADGSDTQSSSSEVLQDELGRGEASSLPSSTVTARSRGSISTGFIAAKVEDNFDQLHEGPLLNRLRAHARDKLSKSEADAVIGIIAFTDVICMIVDIDSRAAGEEINSIVVSIAIVCSIVYYIDFAVRVFGFSTLMFTSFWGILDTVVILAATADYIAASSHVAVDISMLRVLRILRIARLVRVVKQIRWLSELKKLILMMGSCTKTLLWSLVFCFMVMTIWSMLAVDLINPLMQEMVEEGEFADCLPCQRSMSSVMRANLLLFQTIVAGDSWGLVAIPIIERYPLAAIIFCGAQLTLVFGVLNLIVAVIVDSAAEQRQKDVQRLAEEMELDAEDDVSFLKQVFTKIDKDGSGELDYEELVQGAMTVPEFAARLRVMDIDREDLGQFFNMLDDTHAGVIEPDRFISALSRWVFESKTATRFVKYMMMRNMRANSCFHEDVEAKLTHLTQALQVVTEKQDILLRDADHHPHVEAAKKRHNVNDAWDREEEIFVSGALATLMRKCQESEASADELSEAMDHSKNGRTPAGPACSKALQLAQQSALASLEAAELSVRNAIQSSEQSFKAFVEASNRGGLREAAASFNVSSKKAHTFDADDSALEAKSASSKSSLEEDSYSEVV